MPLKPHAGPCPRHRPQRAGLLPLHDAGDRASLLPCLTSSSQYLRITSRALSVISGASSTTLVKILPERGGQGAA